MAFLDGNLVWFRNTNFYFLGFCSAFIISDYFHSHLQKITSKYDSIFNFTDDWITSICHGFF